jgi:hypothetical protein
VNEKKSNAPIIVAVVVVALLLLVVPCILGALLLGGLASWEMQPAPIQEVIEQQPTPVPLPQPQIDVHY